MLECVFCTIFGFNRWESVKILICDRGRLDFEHIRVLRCLKFWKSLYISFNTVLRTVFCCYANGPDLISSVQFMLHVSVMYVSFRADVYVHDHFMTSVDLDLLIVFMLSLL